jgi:hypothetical protein
MTKELNTQEDFVVFQHKLALLAKGIMELPLEEYLERVNMTTTLAPILDPTLYLKGAKSLEEWTEVARAMRDCKDKLLKVKNKILDNGRDEEREALDMEEIISEMRK